MNHFEDNLQKACVTWFRLQYPDIVIFAIPNGGKRNAIEAAKLKATGTLAGVADLFLMQGERMGIYNGLFIEMKVGKGKQTEAQREFEDNANLAFYKYHVCRSFDDFKLIIETYMKP